MRLPFITTTKRRSLLRRKGGGGGHSSEGGESHPDEPASHPPEESSPHDTPSSSTGSHPDTPDDPTTPDAVVPLSSGKTGGAFTYGEGDVPLSTIPEGAPFAGRQEGGAVRSGIYGTSTYGSGYGPGYNSLGRGVSGLGFPYIFWPVVWGSGLGYGPAYLHDSEYGAPDNSSRPGGALYQVQLQPEPPSETYFILTDNSTLQSLIDSIASNCTGANFTSLLPFEATASPPLPEQAIQYYRASSIVLTLNGYNNTAALSDNDTLPNVPLPTIQNTTFLTCVNETIGAAAPLIEDISVSTAGENSASSSLQFSGSLLLLWLVLFARTFC